MSAIEAHMVDRFSYWMFSLIVYFLLDIPVDCICTKSLCSMQSPTENPISEPDRSSSYLRTAYSTIIMSLIILR